MPMDWPAEVNYHEAKAFCAWKGPDYRLPTEAEHHAMRGPQVRLCQSCQQNLVSKSLFLCTNAVAFIVQGFSCPTLKLKKKILFYFLEISLRGYYLRHYLPR